MKRILSFCATLVLLGACAKEPTACECGKNLMKNSKEQDMDLSAACEKVASSLPESKQMEWYNASMECMNEQN
ncbi:MAG: hypothetical protein RIS20_1417 [Bacteroidota bacterium]|jgi:hypothetical protein